MRKSWRRMRVASLAKINLDLLVLGRRHDHFHGVRTILQAVQLHDIVSVTQRTGPFTVRSRSPEMPQDRKNLVWTAGEALWRTLGRPGLPHGVAVTITKRIPSAAGLGGASSDAASALRVLARLWCPGLSDRLIHTVAASVGSDVPFFINGGTVIATGRGEIIRRLPALRLHWVVVAIPWFGISTSAAYRWWDLSQQRRASTRSVPVAWRRHLDRLGNDLEPPVVSRYPEIGEMISRFKFLGATTARMSGSGSAVFGLFYTRDAAVSARRRVRRRGWRTLLTRTVTAAEFESLAEPARIE